MKKLILIALILGLGLGLTGCATSTGQYIWDNRVAVYKVVVKGVTTFQTEEEIKEKGLDKVADLIEYVHAVDSEGNVVE